MEKIFRPSKWFVLFCGLLVLVWAGLQAVANMRIADHAKLIAAQIYTWSWTGPNWRSKAEITEARVVQRTDTDAIVKVRGRQVLTSFPEGHPDDFKNARSEVVDCSATLTFYRSSSNWILGKVELQ